MPTRISERQVNDPRGTRRTTAFGVIEGDLHDVNTYIRSKFCDLNMIIYVITDVELSAEIRQAKADVRDDWLFYYVIGTTLGTNVPYGDIINNHNLVAGNMVFSMHDCEHYPNCLVGDILPCRDKKPPRSDACPLSCEFCKNGVACRYGCLYLLQGYVFNNGHIGYNTGYIT